MTTHTNPTGQTAPVVPGDLFARHQTITGLRALADFLEANPAVPVEEYGYDLTFSVRNMDDASAVALVDRTAALLGVDAADDTHRGGHYIATRSFGRVTYRMVHIPERAASSTAPRPVTATTSPSTTPTRTATRTPGGPPDDGREPVDVAAPLPGLQHHRRRARLGDPARPSWWSLVLGLRLYRGDRPRLRDRIGYRLPASARAGRRVVAVLQLRRDRPGLLRRHLPALLRTRQLPMT